MDTATIATREKLTRRFEPNLKLLDSESAILGLHFPLDKGGSRVPDLGRFKDNALTAYDFQLMRKIGVSIDLNIPLLIEGGSGIGKSEAVEQVCSMINKECYYANCHDFTSDVLIGNMTVVPESKTGFGWVDGIVLQAIRNGGVLFLDEYNFMLGETRGRLHEILDSVLRGKNEVILVENNSERVPVHPNFRIIAAQNPPGEGFTDRYFLDPAQFTRFHYVKEPGTLSEQIKLARTLQCLGVDVQPEIDPDLVLHTNASMTKQELLQKPGMPEFLWRFAEFHDELSKKLFNRDLAADQSQPIYLSFQRELNRVLNYMARYWTVDASKTGEAALRHFFEGFFESVPDRAMTYSMIGKVCNGLLNENNARRKSRPVNGNSALLRPIEFENAVNFSGVVLEKGSNGDRTPDIKRFKENVLTPFDQHLMTKIAIALKLNQPILVEGGSGLGKSEMVEWICALTKQECYYANCHDFTADVLIGSMTTKEGTKSGFGWVDGIVLQAIRNGGVLFLDEYNFMNGEARGRLHEILDTVLRGNKQVVLIENGGEIVPVHPNFRIVAAQNPPGDTFLDRLILDPAQCTRFVYDKEPSEMPLGLKLARAMALVDQEIPDNLLAPMHVGSQKISMEELQKIPGAVDLICNKLLQFQRAVESVVTNGGLAMTQPQPVFFSFQRDFDRVLGYIQNCYDGDLNSTIRSALHYYFVNRFETKEDKAKVVELLAHVRATPISDQRRTKVTTSQTLGVSSLEMQGLAFLTELQKRGVSAEVLLQAMAGFISETAHKCRSDMFKRYPEAVMQSLVGCDDPRSMSLREKIIAEHPDNLIPMLAASLRSLDSFPANEMRKRFKIEPHVTTVAGLDTSMARKVREKYENTLFNSVTSRFGMQIGDLGELIASYTGMTTSDAKRIRERGWSAQSRRGEILRSFAYIDDIPTEDFRSVLATSNTPLINDLLEGLAGVDCSSAWITRNMVMEKRPDLWESLCISLAGVESDKAWKMREALLQKATTKEQLSQLALSITGGPFLAGVRRALDDQKRTGVRFLRDTQTHQGMLVN